VTGKSVDSLEENKYRHQQAFVYRKLRFPQLMIRSDASLLALVIVIVVDLVLVISNKVLPVGVRMETWQS
jgi:hypothetical protein